MPADIDFISLHDSSGAFRIIVESRDTLNHGQGRRVRRWAVNFRKPYAYRNADEGKRLKSLSILTGGGGIYAVENSSLAEWLHEESGYTRETRLSAWAVVTINDWIEVVGGAPEVKEIMGDES
ncbi:MAG TPA: hypothetical protein VHD56_01060 [Tepidisphaeraceae bacterium]|nr:hypothetical protein [Tepidisphaeraceae bacterium]